jgi:DNA-binding LacI/PurR family transcriptional regulator
MRPPTIRDVAERAGVSKSLVSLALRGSDQVRPEKRDAVLRAARELGYRPNAAARSLSEQRTRTVGVLLNDLRNPWFVDLLDGLNSLLHANGLHMLLADARLNRRTGQDPADPLLELRVDGLVVVGTLPDPAALGAVAERIPVVLAGSREPAPPGVDVVAGDDERGARLVAEHLVGLGHRRIAHIAGYGAVGELRRRSFEAAMRRHGLAEQAVVEPSDMTEEGGYRTAVRLLSRPERPTAVFASAAEELGLRVPRDLSVVGYDNTSIARLRHVWLTTADNSSHEVGRRAARCLLERFEGAGGAGRVQLATPTLEIRGSTAPAP